MVVSLGGLMTYHVKCLARYRAQSLGKYLLPPLPPPPMLVLELHTHSLGVLL